jgi:hypothetical protein
MRMTHKPRAGKSLEVDKMLKLYVAVLAGCTLVRIDVIECACAQMQWPNRLVAIVSCLM